MNQYYIGEQRSQYHRESTTSSENQDHEPPIESESVDARPKRTDDMVRTEPLVQRTSGVAVRRAMSTVQATEVGKRRAET